MSTALYKSIFQVSSLLWGKYLILEDPFEDSLLPTLSGGI